MTDYSGHSGPSNSFAPSLLNCYGSESWGFSGIDFSIFSNHDLDLEKYSAKKIQLWILREIFLCIIFLARIDICFIYMVHIDIGGVVDVFQFDGVQWWSSQVILLSVNNMFLGIYSPVQVRNLWKKRSTNFWALASVVMSLSNNQVSEESAAFDMMSITYISVLSHQDFLARLQSRIHAHKFQINTILFPGDDTCTNG